MYVDDILITRNTQQMIEEVKAHLHSLYTIKDMRQAIYFLGIELHALDILKDAKMEAATPVNDPANHGINLSDVGKPLSNPEEYRKIIGRLLYMGFTRPDLSYMTQQLSLYMKSPYLHHLQVAHHVLRYLKRTLNCGLFYPKKSDLSLKGYCDADWGRCIETRKSLTGFCIFIGNSLIS